MTGPAYHLRPNKAIDRLALMEAIRHLARLGRNGLRGYTYYGLGGPYLEDFRLLYELYPKIRMVSFEGDKDVFKRQQFNLICRSLQLVRENLTDFISRYNPGNAKSIFWADYTELKDSCFSDFQCLLGKVASDSMIKITLPSDPDDLLTPSKRRSPDNISKFYDEFDKFIPNKSGDPPRDPKGFACFLQDMIQFAAEDALPYVAKGRQFIPVSSFYYADRKPMFTITGVVCRGYKVENLKKIFADWEHANSMWDAPKLIKLPTLTTKERLYLQPWMPTKASGKTLWKILKYLVDDDRKKTEEALEQYATFHRYAPYFLKGIP